MFFQVEAAIRVNAALHCILESALARFLSRQKYFDTSRKIVFLMRDRKMSTAFTNMHQPMRVNGHTSIWQRCGLAIGVAGSDL